MACTIAMVVLPIGSYFLSLNTLFNGNTPPPPLTPTLLLLLLPSLPPTFHPHPTSRLLIPSTQKEIDNLTPPGNNIYSAILAALVANLVLAAFVVQALREDRADKRQDKPEGKKER